MSDIAIQVEGLSKLYRIGGKQERYKTLRDTLTDAAIAPFCRLSSLVLRHSSDGDERRKTNDEWIWALKDVSFEVRRGEVVGIIGRNGAGKSTLLKILSRITEPTEGYAEIHGRVGSLLEVGTGFHPELTGRENIYLNGAILGMKKTEIERKFGEIVAFAEIEKFIDTPVKHYSSGMYVRLAFAVAAHLEPEILLVDEVLAVGDAAFQKKCLGKMGDVAREGRTVLFVSHNMGAIRRLCQRTLVLNGGRILLEGDSETAINTYLSQISGDEAIVDFKSRCQDAPKRVGFVDVWFENTMGRTKSAISGEPLSVCLGYVTTPDKTLFDWGITIYDGSGEPILHFGSLYSRLEKLRVPQAGIIICKLPQLPLPAGRYRLNVSMHAEGSYLDHIVGAALLDVHEGDFFGTGRIPPASTSKVLVNHSWFIEEMAG